MPDEIYLDRLAETQCKALLIARDQLNPRDWNRAIEPYLSDLRLDSVDMLLDAGVLREAYQKNLKPLMSIAKLQGFQSGWMYDMDRKG